MFFWVITRGYMRQSGCHINTGAIHMQLLFVTIRGIVFHTALRREVLTWMFIALKIARCLCLIMVDDFLGLICQSGCRIYAVTLRDDSWYVFKTAPQR